MSKLSENTNQVKATIPLPYLSSPKDGQVSIHLNSNRPTRICTSPVHREAGKLGYFCPQGRDPLHGPPSGKPLRLISQLT